MPDFFQHVTVTLRDVVELIIVNHTLTLVYSDYRQQGPVVSIGLNKDFAPRNRQYLSGDAS